MSHERVVERLNGALHELFAADERMYLLGEDVLDPYGGAFKATRGLSTAYPDRVLATPLSEGGIVGVASGLALAGDRVVVEVMFGDFLGLAFDQLLNFASKSVAMYGRPVPMPIVVRCPVGGHRGYGPTHSQSPQKHFIGIPHLALFEISAMHDPGTLLRAALLRNEPCLLFEDKVLYGQRVHRDGIVDDDYRFRELPGPGSWIQVYRPGAPAAAAVLIATGGVVGRAMTAIRDLYVGTGAVVDLFVPGQLYPFEPDAILPALAVAGRVCVAEESTAGGTWGSEVASRLQDRLWVDLRAPVGLVCSGSGVIPAAPHLERGMLLQSDDIATALTAVLAHEGRPQVSRTDQPPPAPPVPGGPAVDGAGTSGTDRDDPGPGEDIPEEQHGIPGHPVLMPVLNPNDTHAVLVDWLVPDGATVPAGTPIAEVETSKAMHEIEAEQAGTLRHVRRTGDECRFGTVIGAIVGNVPSGSATRVTPAAPAAAVPVALDVSAGPGTSPAVSDLRPTGEDETAAGTRIQAAVAAAVTRSHRDIPAAFCAVRIDLDDAIAMLDQLGDEAVIDLPALFVKAIAVLHGEFPGFFGTTNSAGDFVPAPPHVAVTVDADTGLFLPVIRDAHERTLDEIADRLIEFQLCALDGRFAGEQLADPAISLSLNMVDGVVLVEPLVMPPQVCMVSVCGVEREVRLAADNTWTEVRVVTVGLAYDHRVINGRAAASFLAALRRLISDPYGHGASLR